MAANKIICPLEHDSGVLWGGLPTLGYRLFQLLADNPLGLHLGQIERALSRQNAPGDNAEQVLIESKYFCQTERGMWDLAVRRPLRWGIAGCGKIAEDFAAALTTVPGAQRTAAASSSGGLSSLERAQVFADAHGFERAYGSYEDLAADPKVDIVYLAMLHTGHCAAALLMIAAGKHVLVEKPFAMNEREARKMIKAAKKKGVFLMEGMWSRFFPAEQGLRSLIQRGVIGEALQADARFTFAASKETRRLFDPKLGGGGLLDIGIYPIALMSWVFGQESPSDVTALAVMHPEGADASGSAQLRFGEKGLALAQWSFLLDSPQIAHIYGTKGEIDMRRTHCPEHLRVTYPDGKQKVFDFPNPDVPGAHHGPPQNQGFHFSGSGGFVYEAAAVHSAVVNGWNEMDDMPLSTTLALAKTLDRIRWQLCARRRLRASYIMLRLQARA